MKALFLLCQHRQRHKRSKVAFQESANCVWSLGKFQLVSSVFMSSRQLTLTLAPLKPPDLPLPSPSTPEAVCSTPVVRDRQGWSEQPLFMPATQLTPDPRHVHSWKQSVIIYLFIVRGGESFLWDKLLLVFDERWICWLFSIWIFLTKQTFKLNIWTFWISSHLISSSVTSPPALRLAGAAGACRSSLTILNDTWNLKYIFF